MSRDYQLITAECLMTGAAAASTAAPDFLSHHSDIINRRQKFMQRLYRDNRLKEQFKLTV